MRPDSVLILTEIRKAPDFLYFGEPLHEAVVRRRSRVDIPCSIESLGTEQVFTLIIAEALYENGSEIESRSW